MIFKKGGKLLKNDKFIYNGITLENNKSKQVFNQKLSYSLMHLKVSTSHWLKVFTNMKQFIHHLQITSKAFWKSIKQAYRHLLCCVYLSSRVFRDSMWSDAQEFSANPIWNNKFSPLTLIYSTSRFSNTTQSGYAYVPVRIW